MDFAETFGISLKALRKNNGLTQKELARRTGIGQTAIANYESGKRFPDQATLVRIADILETSTDSLLGRSGFKTGSENNFTEGFSYQPSDLGGRTGEFTENALSSWAGTREMILGLRKSGFTEEQIILDLLSPALSECGNAWAEGRFNEAMEHQISMTVADSIMLLRFNSEQGRPAAGRAVLLTASGERHNIGLRMLGRFLEIDGWNCFFLGSSVPPVTLRTYVKDSDIDLVMISVTMNDYADSAIGLTRTLKEAAAPPYVMAGGRRIIHNRESLLAAGADFVDSDILKTMSAAGKIRSQL